jgi:uncharacterized membrane protein
MLRKYFAAGLIILLPLVLTLVIVVFLFDLFTDPFVPVVAAALNMLPIALPHGVAVFVSRLIALVLLCILILVLGVIARHFFLKNILQLTNRILDRIPFIKTVYKISREMVSAFFSTEEKKAFKYPVLYPFPYPPYQAVGFATGESAAECSAKVGIPLTSVFAPTAPHPISGFLFMFPKDKVEKLDMTNEDALKLLVSCGVIVPVGQEAGSLPRGKQ